MENHKDKQDLQNTSPLEYTTNIIIYYIQSLNLSQHIHISTLDKTRAKEKKIPGS